MRRSGFNVMMRLIGLVRPMLPFMLLAIFLGVLGFSAATAITLLGGYGILTVLTQSGQALAPLFVVALGCAIARGGLRYSEQLCNHYIAFKLLGVIRNRVFAALRRLCPAKLDGKDKGNLISVLTSDVELLEVFYAHTISPVMIAFVMTAIMTAFIGQFHPLLGLAALLSYLVVGAVLPLIAARKTQTLGRVMRDTLGELNSYVLESLHGMGESIQFGGTETRRKGMNRRSGSMAEINKVFRRSTGKSSARTNTAISLCSLVMLLAALWLYERDMVAIEGVIMSVIALMSSFGPTVALSNLGTGLQQTIGAGNRVLDILDEKPVTEDVSGHAEVEFSAASCRDVGFSYDKEQILCGISVDIPEGMVVGITGKSGSGKSTLLKLLMRFWDRDSGDVAISGKDIRKINTNNLRNMESLVTQNTSLFNDSIEANIKIGNLNATHEQVTEAAKKASIHEFIESLPQGYDTVVGELGDRLSGGERQRIGLARMFLHDAPFILLDEPTSNLDSLNEAVILKALHEECGGKTVVLVSHRASTMQIAEKIYSVRSGRLS